MSSHREPQRDGSMVLATIAFSTGGAVIGAILGVLTWLALRAFI